MLFLSTSMDFAVVVVRFTHVLWVFVIGVVGDAG